MLRIGLEKAGLKGNIVANVMPWFNGDGKHPDIGYLSQEPWVIQKQLDCMQALDVDDVCVTYSGSRVSPLAHITTLQMAYQCQQRKMGFSLMLNASMVSGLPDKSKATDEVLRVLDLSEVRYMLGLGKNNVYEFDLGKNGVNIDAIGGELTTRGRSLGSKHTGFTWPDKKDTVGVMENDFKANKPSITMAVLTRYFNDGAPSDRSKSTWDITQPATVLPARAGNFWHDQVAVVAGYNPQVDIGIVWNDDQEGNEWESIASVLTGLRIV